METEPTAEELERDADAAMRVAIAAKATLEGAKVRRFFQEAAEKAKAAEVFQRDEEAAGRAEHSHQKPTDLADKPNGWKFVCSCGRIFFLNRRDEEAKVIHGVRVVTDPGISWVNG